MGKKIALGDHTEKVGTGIVSRPADIHEQVAVLKDQVEIMTRAIRFITESRMNDRSCQVAHNMNMDGIPIGISLVGISTGEDVHVLVVADDGYYTNQLRFDSLSAAAEAVDSDAKDGWTFWRLSDGRTVKEAFGK